MMSPDRAIPAAVLREAAGFAILTVMKVRLRCVLKGDRQGMCRCVGQRGGMQRSMRWPKHSAHVTQAC